MKKAIIGIVAKHRNIELLRPDTFIRDELKDAIFYNGGIAIGILPPCRDITLVNPFNEREAYEKLNSLLTLKEREDLINQIELCNGIILCGGSASDAYEMLIAKYCYEKDIPILAICAGHSNMVRGIGGSTKRIDGELHNKPRDNYAHNILVDKYSRFYKFERI